MRRLFRLRRVSPAAFHETWRASLDVPEEFRQRDLQNIAEGRERKNSRVGESTLDLRHKCPVDLSRKRQLCLTHPSGKTDLFQIMANRLKNRIFFGKRWCWC